MTSADTFQDLRDIPPAPSESAALAYAAMGWPVLPCHGIVDGRCTCGRSNCKSPGKHPRTINGLKNASTDPRQVRKWWAKWPDANVATLTDGKAVLDVDQAKNGKQAGRESLAALEGEHGKLPETVYQVTGGGGEQYFFNANGTPVRSTNEGVLAVNIDTRGEGGYAVLPPSRHASGGVYRWAEGHDPASVALAAVPAWIPRLVPHKPKAETKPTEKAESRHSGLRRQTLRDARARTPKADTLARALESVDGKALCAEGRRGEIVRLVDGAYLLPTAFRLTDQGNAERFAADHVEVVRYCHTSKKWLIWDGRCWRPDDVRKVLTLATATVREMYTQAAGVDDEIARKSLAKHAAKSEGERGLRAMLELASAVPCLAITDEPLNKKPMLLNCANGTLDLKTFNLRPHDPADMLTYCLDVPYHADADEDSVWVPFLLDIFDRDIELIYFVQRACGYTLSGEVSEQCFFLLYGHGANGKSTFVKALSNMLGGFLAQNARFETFLYNRDDGIPNDIARMKDARLVTAIEADAGKQLSEALIKQLTGGDAVTARFLHREFFDFTPQFKLWLSANHKPGIYGTDFAMWRRVKLIPFNVKFDGDACDETMPEKLTAALPGILRWAVEGCRMWQNGGLGTCTAVESGTAAYRSDEDLVGKFLADECVLGTTLKIKKDTLYKSYKAWAEAKGEYELSKRIFGTRLQDRDEITSDRTGQARVWVGVDLNNYNHVDDAEPEDRKTSPVQMRMES